MKKCKHRSRTYKWLVAFLQIMHNDGSEWLVSGTAYSTAINISNAQASGRKQLEGKDGDADACQYDASAPYSSQVPAESFLRCPRDSKVLYAVCVSIGYIEEWRAYRNDVQD